MKDKPKPRPRSKPTTTQPPEDLVTLLSKVLNHPQLPTTLANDLGESMCELFNDLSREQKTRIEHNPARIALLLAATAANEKGDA